MTSFIGNIHNKKILKERKEVSDCVTSNGYIGFSRGSEMFQN